MPEQQQKPLSILVVEDAPEILRFLARRLSQLAPTYPMLTAQSGKEALPYCAAHTFLLAIVDYRLPGGMTGLEVIVALKASSPLVRTVLISASPTDALETEAIAAGVERLLVKPFTLPELDQVVRSLLLEAS
jgi:CheY-like chemotaxis protein